MTAKSIPSRGLRTDEAAELVGMQPNTLKNWRTVGGGPPFRKVGRRVVYLEAELLAWLAAQPRFE